MSIHENRAKIAAILLTGRFPKKFEFQMIHYLSRLLAARDCGTAGCVAGLTVQTFLPLETALNCDNRTEAANLLGINLGEADNLFEPACHPSSTGIWEHKTITHLQAGRVLANLHLTGEVDWSVRDTPIKVGGRIF